MAFPFLKIHSIRFKLIASMAAVSLFVGLVSLIVGVNLLYRAVLDEAKNRITQDLNVARVIYNDQIDSIRMALTLSASMPHVVSSVSERNRMDVSRVLDGLAGQVKPDFIGVSDTRGHLIARSGHPESGNDEDVNINPLVSLVLKHRQPLAGTFVMTEDELRRENPKLIDRARIPMPTGQDQAYACAMLVGAAVPVWSGDNMAGVLYGGFLLNRDNTIVDTIGETVFKNEIYKGRNIGTATIFHTDHRIATSVKDAAGNRALGTLASKKVTHRVLDNGEKWTDRARVLDNWYITAYEPITDVFGERVGMLYVGVLEVKYADIRRHALTVFFTLTMAGVLIAIILVGLITSRIMRPVSHLIHASGEVSKGNFFPDIGPISKDDIGQLQREFLIMTEALKQREKSQKAESEIRLMQSEKQASVGKLAAGVAHEINNPLTAVLTFTHMILRRKDLPDEVRSDLETVSSQTQRVRTIVKSLLDFSRQSALDAEPVDVNNLIEESIRLLENQALIKRVELSFTGEPNLPLFVLDSNQCLSVLINMILNALDATSPGGSVRIQTWKASVDKEEGVSIVITDTGCGIPPENMDRLFDPFFTTKEVGKGTGLGLAVSQGIIQRHGGTIHVRSTPGEGTVFTIWLPHKRAGEFDKG